MSNKRRFIRASSSTLRPNGYVGNCDVRFISQKWDNEAVIKSDQQR